MWYFQTLYSLIHLEWHQSFHFPSPEIQFLATPTGYLNDLVQHYWPEFFARILWDEFLRWILVSLPCFLPFFSTCDNYGNGGHHLTGWLTSQATTVEASLSPLWPPPPPPPRAPLHMWSGLLTTNKLLMDAEMLEIWKKSQDEKREKEQLFLPSRMWKTPQHFQYCQLIATTG